MGDAVRELTHDLCQRGPAMRKQRAEHPSWNRDMGKLFGWITGRKIRSDAKGMMTVSSAMPRGETFANNHALLKNQQRKSTWRVHQSEPVENYGKCYWDDCPGKKSTTAKRPESNKTHMRCEECSACLGKNVFLCNGFVKGGPVSCHRQYHIYHHNKEFESTSR